MEIIQGDLIALAQAGEFDVIAHGCNCFCAQKSGIARQMVAAFHTDDIRTYKLERQGLMGDVNKLGQIEAGLHSVNFYSKEIDVVNCYTQFLMGTDKPYVDYEALTLCMRKLNHYYKGKRIGLPQIGCGLAGGKWSIVKDIIEKELIDCRVTIVEYRP
jgi:O-acetyl-ADP-ribose deacetylase (regulator of RNase III)